MSKHLHIVDARPEHLLSFLPDIRKPDEEEWVAGTGMRTRQSMGIAMQTGRAWSALDHRGECWAIWGVLPKHLLGDSATGIAWMAASKKAQRHIHAMHRLFKEGMQLMHSYFHHLEAWASSKNTLHHTWMERYGWRRTGDMAQFALPGHSFIKFERLA